MGGNAERGFNDNSTRGYPARMSLTTRQVTDVVMCDEHILAVKGGRQVSAPEPQLDDEARKERIRQLGASRYLQGYPEARVVDPIQTNYPACTMPLAATSPIVVTPEILNNTLYAQEYVRHVALVRDLLGQASLPTSSVVLQQCSNKLFQSLAGLLTGASNSQLTREPIPAWNVVKVVRTKSTSALVGSTTDLMIHDGDAHLNMPGAPLPIPDVDDQSVVHSALVTELTEGRPYYRKGGLIPHLPKKGFFWKSTRTAIHETIYEHQIHLDPTDPDKLKGVEHIPCGWIPPVPKISDYTNKGQHISLGIDSLQSTSSKWVAKDGTTPKSASLGVPPTRGGSVQGLTQHFEQMSKRSSTPGTGMGLFLDDTSDPPAKVKLNHDEISWEYYSGHYFAVPELTPGVDRYHGTTVKMNALGGELVWTLNHEVVFSAALTGRPLRKAYFAQYCWNRCVVGTTTDYAPALDKQQWELALLSADLYSLQSYDVKETMVLSPCNNTDYLNVAAFLEAFWGYLWPTSCHNGVPPQEGWTALHGGLKEFIDHAVSVLGRTHLKPTTECVRGVVTYPSGDTQGRYKMSLTDLMKDHYTRAVREAKLDVILNRSDNVVKEGDSVEMLLGISFGVKDSMLSWEWLGINPKEWPPQRLDWEMYRLEHLAFASKMEEQMTGWINYPWHVLYSALRCMAYRDWKRQHSCPICRTFHRNSGSSHDAWAYFDGCLTHLDSTPKCIGNLLMEDTLNASGASLIPSVATLLEELSPRKRARDWLPALTILYMAPGGHRQWPMSIKPLLDRLSWIVMVTRPLALTHLQNSLRTRPDWQPRCRRGPSIELVPAVPYKFLDIGTQMGCYHIKELISKEDKTNILHPRFASTGIPPVGTFHSIVQNRVGDNRHADQWCLDDAWFKASWCHDFWVTETLKYRWGLPVIIPTCPRKMFASPPRLKYVDVVTDTLHASSSDLIVWNTLVLMKLRWVSDIPKEWMDITYNSLEAWSERDRLSPFHNDNRRGYARVTPLA